MADPDHEVAHALEERHVVGNGVAVGQHPARVLERVVDQARHVVPAAQVQAQDVVAQRVEELLHLVGERMGLDQRHAADGVAGPATRLGHRLEGVAPPHRLLRRLRLGDVDAQRVPHALGLDLVDDEREVEQRGRGEPAGGHAGLGEVEAAHPAPDDGRAGRDAHPAPALRVLVGQAAVERRDDVGDAPHELGPAVRHRVLEVEHDPGGPGVEHLDHQLGVVGRAGHLVALVAAPGRQLDAPRVAGRGRGWEVIGQGPAMGRGQHRHAARRQGVAARGEPGVQRQVELHEAARQVALGLEVRRRAVHACGGLGVDRGWSGVAHEWQCSLAQTPARPRIGCPRPREGFGLNRGYRQPARPV